MKKHPQGATCFVDCCRFELWSYDVVLYVWIWTHEYTRHTYTHSTHTHRWYTYINRVIYGSKYKARTHTYLRYIYTYIYIYIYTHTYIYIYIQIYLIYLLRCFFFDFHGREIPSSPKHLSVVGSRSQGYYFLWWSNHIDSVHISRLGLR